MSNKYDGGPAFPPLHDPNTHVFGMTLRDHFASQALQGRIVGCMMKGYTDDSFDIARAAYELADAMLEERGK